MPFPRSEKVIYQKPPLVEVICQLRFPANLRIEASSPVEFQDAVKAEFPIYRSSLSSPSPRPSRKFSTQWTCPHKSQSRSLIHLPFSKTRPTRLSEPLA